jgi:hypothetical protein
MSGDLQPGNYFWTVMQYSAGAPCWPVTSANGSKGSKNRN